MKWTLRTLDELGYVSRGRSRHRPRDAAHLYNGPYPFIQTADVKHARLYVNSYSQTYSEEGLAQSRRWKAGTLCITIAANIADTAILGVDACFPDSIVGFVADERKADVRFVKYLFDAAIQERFKQFTQGAAQDNLSNSKLLSLQFSVPEVDNQRRIADVLSGYDDLIENSHRRIRVLKEAARLLYEDWFVRLRFPGYESTRITDGVPEEWEKKVLGDVIARLESGGRPKGGATEKGVPSIGAENVVGIGEYDYSKDKFVPEEYFNAMRQGIVRDRDVVVYKDGANIGRTSYFGAGFPHVRCAVNEHVFVVRGLPEIGQSFLYFWISQDETRQRIANLNANTAQPGVSQKRLETLAFVRPSRRILYLFNEAVEPIVRQIFVLALQNRNLAQARNVLLARMTDGEIVP